MKKFFSGLLTGLLFSLIFCTAAVGYAERTIHLFVNNREIVTDIPPLMIDGRVMVPVRFVSESLGASVSWDESSYSVFINNSQQSPPIYDYNAKTSYYERLIKLFELVKKNMDDCDNIVKTAGFTGSTYQIEKRHIEIETVMADLKNYPPGYELYYSALLEYYSVYCEYKNLICSKDPIAYNLQIKSIIDKYNMALSKLRITMPQN